jgi:hypothetical protein
MGLVQVAVFVSPNTAALRAIKSRISKQKLRGISAKENGSPLTLKTLVTALHVGEN